MNLKPVAHQIEQTIYIYKGDVNLFLHITWSLCLIVKAFPNLLLTIQSFRIYFDNKDLFYHQDNGSLHMCQQSLILRLNFNLVCLSAFVHSYFQFI